MLIYKKIKQIIKSPRLLAKDPLGKNSLRQKNPKELSSSTKFLEESVENSEMISKKPCKLQ